MKIQCLILGLLILVAIMAICVMVKFSTDMKDERKLDAFYEDHDKGVLRSLGVISLTSDNKSMSMAKRFPYTAAVLRNATSTWHFACFASVILVKWIVTNANCRQAGSKHRVLVYYDYVYNQSRTYPILFWRIHENFNKTLSPIYDIAVAKLNIDSRMPYNGKSAVVADGFFGDDEEVVASVWKTVASMNRKLYLTNDFSKFDIRIVQPHRCYESYGIILDRSMFCVDMSDYEDCFMYDFGPIYYKDTVVGLSSVKPRECDSKLAIFTNVSFYADWILKSSGIDS